MANVRRRALLIAATAASLCCLGAASAQAQIGEIVDPPDIPILSGVDLTTQRNAAIEEMLKINPDLQLPATLPPVDGTEVVDVPDTAQELQGRQLEAAVSGCPGQTLYQGFRGGIGLFMYRASSYTDMRCAGSVVYSCRARVQAQLAGLYTTVATGPLRAASIGLLCQSSVNSGSFVNDLWRTNNTYTLIRYDRAVWGAPTNICQFGSGTPIMRCAVRRTFRDGANGRVPIR